MEMWKSLFVLQRNKIQVFIFVLLCKEKMLSSFSPNMQTFGSNKKFVSLFYPPQNRMVQMLEATVSLFAFISNKNNRHDISPTVDTALKHCKHRVYRVLGFLSSHPYWVPSAAREFCSPALQVQGGDTLVCEGGGRCGDPIPTMVKTRWYRQMPIFRHPFSENRVFL